MMVCCVAASACWFDTTERTLNFAKKCMKIKTMSVEQQEKTRDVMTAYEGSEKALSKKPDGWRQQLKDHKGKKPLEDSKDPTKFADWTEEAKRLGEEINAEMEKAKGIIATAAAKKEAAATR